MSPPRYQEILSANIPVARFDGGGSARVIAGEFEGVIGPAKTFTPITVLDVRLPAGCLVNINFPDGYTTLVLVLKGTTLMNGTEAAGDADLAVFGRAGDRFTIAAEEDATALILGGEPIDEPVASYGPFVMNTEAEIRQAIEDYRTGRMGHIASP